MSTKSRAVSAISRCSSVRSIFGRCPEFGGDGLLQCHLGVGGTWTWLEAVESIAETGWISRTVDARKASDAPRQVADGEVARVHVKRLHHGAAGERVEDADVQRGVLRTPSEDPEDRRGRRLEHDAVRADEQGLVGTATLGDPRRLHVGAVGERLDPV